MWSNKWPEREQGPAFFRPLYGLDWWVPMSKVRQRVVWGYEFGGPGIIWSEEDPPRRGDPTPPPHHPSECGGKIPLTTGQKKGKEHAAQSARIKFLAQNELEP